MTARILTHLNKFNKIKTQSKKGLNIVVMGLLTVIPDIDAVMQGNVFFIPFPKQKELPLVIQNTIVAQSLFNFVF